MSVPIPGLSDYNFTDSDEEDPTNMFAGHATRESHVRPRINGPSKAGKLPMEAGLMLPAFVLKPGVNFSTWRNVLKNELKAWNMAGLLEGDHPAEREETIGWTNAFILSRVDDKLKQAVADVDTPAQMIMKLQNLVQPVIPQARFAVKRAFQTIKMRNDETVGNFITRFDDSMKQMQLYEGPVDKKTREIDATDNFLAAIKDNYKDVVTTFNAKPDEEKTLDTLKAILKSEEAALVDVKQRADGDDGDKTAAHTFRSQNYGYRARNVRGRYPRSRGQTGVQVQRKRCTRCGKPNHSYKECYNPKWLCYSCNELTDNHQAWNCRTAKSKFKIDRANNQPPPKKFPQKKPQYGLGANNTSVNDLETECPGKVFSFLSDSGADEHFVNSLSSLINVRSIQPVTIKSADKRSQMLVTHVGDILTRDDQGKKILIKKVYYSEHLSKNLLSIRRWALAGAKITLDCNQIEIRDRYGKVVVKGRFDGKFWWIKLPVICSERNALNSELQMEGSNTVQNAIGEHDYEKKTFSYKDIRDAESLSKYINVEAEMNLNDLKNLSNDNVRSLKDNIGFLWHLRLGHASKSYLEYAARKLPELIRVKFTNSIVECGDCKLAKATALPNSTVRQRCVEPLHGVHTDLMGPVDPPTAKHKARYIVSFIDDATRYAVSFPLTEKKFVHIALEKYLKHVRKVRGPSAKIGFIRRDNGTEYSTKEMKDIIDREKIEIQTSPPASSNLNGTAEKFNRDIMNITRVLLISSGFPETMWAYALSFAVDVHNRTPRSSIKYECPYQLFHDRKATVRYIRRFGCLGFAYTRPAAGKKFCERAVRGFLIHCADTHYVLIQPATGKIIRSQNVVFIESKVYGDFYPKDCVNALTEGNFAKQTFEEEWSLESYEKVEKVENVSKNSSSENANEIRENFLTCLNAQFTDDSVQSVTLCKADKITEPKTYKEAMVSKNKDDWIVAINNEFLSQEKNKTWSLVNKDTLPEKTPILRSRWVFKCKNEPINTIKFKARLVIKGYADKNSYDLSDTYSPVARSSDVRFFFSVANKFGLQIHQLDVTTAFLHGTLEQPIYMTIPEGYKDREKLVQTKVCFVQKAIYGLKVSPKRWYTKIKDELLKLKFHVYPFQSCLFVWRNSNRFVLLLLYVDDMLIISNCPDKVTEIKTKLGKSFDIKDLQNSKKFVGFEIVRNQASQTLFLHQKSMIEGLLKRYHMEDCHPCDTPCTTIEARKKTEVHFPDTLASFEHEMPFREVVGSLLYIANGTRPDIAFAVNIVSRNQDKYTIDDYMKVVRILRYLQGSKNMGLQFTGRSNTIECFVDASLGTNDIAGKSTTGYIVKLFGDVISWRSKKQVHVALSSAEAEFIAMSVACKEVVCVREMTKRLLHLDIIPIIYEDNTSAIKMAKTEDSQSLKHIVKLCYHYVRFEAIKRNVTLVWVSTADQLADGFTKALPKPKFQSFQESVVSRIN